MTTTLDSAVLETTRPFLLFDYLRVPYCTLNRSSSGPEVRLPPLLAAGGRLRCTTPHGPPATLYWPLFPLLVASWALPPRSFAFEGIILHGRLVDDSVAQGQLVRANSGWRRSTALKGDSGETVGSLWRDDEGNLFLPFDPGEVITNYWSERYQDIRTSGASRWARRTALRSYYQIRPLLPRPLQIRLRQTFTRLQSKSRFPRWPVETVLHDFYDFLLRCVADLAGRPVPWIAPWPSGCSWALVLTHDVETAAGYDYLPVLRKVEEQSGYRSAWNFVPKRYDVDDSLVHELAQDGFEVGVHGLYHDGRDLEPDMAARLPAMREFADRWNAAGFRSPATLRSWERMPLLGFDYDSSYPDSDPYEPQPGGCCTWWPFFNQELVELPITVPQDHTVFVILGNRDASLWREKIDFLRAAGGMALVITHPDYLRDDTLTNIYRGLLERYRHDTTAWRALPGEVSDWWRRRAASSLEVVDGHWRVVGPAADEATLKFVEPS